MGKVVEPEFTVDWLGVKTRYWTPHLNRLVDKPARALEIGSYEGRSAIWTIENILIHPQSTLICVDPWPDEDVETRFDRNTFRYRRIQKRKGLGQDVLREMDRHSFDFIYVDGDHSRPGTMTLSVLAWELLKVGGILIWDDYLWKNPNKHECVGLPKPAIDAFLALYEHEIRLLHRGYQVIVERTAGE